MTGLAGNPPDGLTPLKRRTWAGTGPSRRPGRPLDPLCVPEKENDAISCVRGCGPLCPFSASLPGLPAQCSHVGVRRASAYFLYKCFPTQKSVFQRGVFRPMGALRGSSEGDGQGSLGDHDVLADIAVGRRRFLRRRFVLVVVLPHRVRGPSVGRQSISSGPSSGPLLRLDQAVCARIWVDGMSVRASRRGEGARACGPTKRERGESTEERGRHERAGWPKRERTFASGWQCRRVARGWPTGSRQTTASRTGQCRPARPRRGPLASAAAKDEFKFE